MLKWWVGGFRAFLAPCAFICPPSLCSPFSHGLRRMRLSYFFYVSSDCGICWLRLCFLLCLTHVWGLTLAVVDSMGPFVTKLTNSNSPDLVREKVNGWSKHSIQSLWTAYCGCELLRILLCIYMLYILCTFNFMNDRYWILSFCKYLIHPEFDPLRWWSLVVLVWEIRRSLLY